MFKRNSFVVGFSTAAALWLAWFVFNNWRFQGGHVEDSPSGKYTLMITAPMEPTSGGTYHVTLLQKATGKTLRTVKIQLNANEQTQPLRGQPITMTWDAAESIADIAVDGDFLVRLSVP